MKTQTGSFKTPCFLPGPGAGARLGLRQRGEGMELQAQVCLSVCKPSSTSVAQNSSKVPSALREDLALSLSSWRCWSPSADTIRNRQAAGRESAPLTPPAPAQLQELGTPPQQHQSIPQSGVMGVRAVPQGGFRPGTGKERRLGETHEHCCRPPQMKRRDTFSSCHREQRADRCTPSPVRYVRCV